MPGSGAGLHKLGSKGISFRMKVILTGLLGGVFGGLLGIGGSFLVIPILSGPLGLSHHKAHATALPVAFVSGFSALGFYVSSGHVDVALSLEVMVSSLLGVFLGARLMRYVRGSWLSVLFGFFLLVIAAGFAFHLSGADPGGTSPSLPFIKPAALGLVAGIVSGLFGAGGGIILVPGAVLLLHVSEPLAQGISLMVIAPTTLLGTWIHCKAGNLSPRVTPPLMVAALGGGLLGGFMASVLHIAILKGLLIVVLLSIGVRSIWNNWPKTRTPAAYLDSRAKGTYGRQ